MSRYTTATTTGYRPRHVRAAVLTQRGHVAGIDGLRGLAVAAVIVFHAFPSVLPGGFIGVDAFFVISGFLITRNLAAVRAAGALRLGTFWARRARRILPALLPFLLVWSLVVLLIGGPIADGFVSQMVGAVTFSSNWVAISADHSYFLTAAPDLLKNLWSLAIEEQFYLIWPVVLLLLWRTGPTVRVLGALLLAACSATAMALLSTPGQDPSRVYYGTDTHAFGLLLGAATALALHGPRGPGTRAGSILRATLGGGALVLLSWLALHLAGTSPNTYRGGLVAASAATAALIAVLPGRASLGTLLDWSPLAAIGKRSYGLYLWHWPLLVLVTTATTDHLDDDAETTIGIAARILAIGVAILCAWTSYRVFEQPALTPETVLGPRARPVLSLPVALAVLLLGATIASTAVVAGRPTAATAAEQQIATGQAAIRQHRIHRHLTTAPTRASNTTPATASPSPTETTSARPTEEPLPAGVTAIGDSVMLAAAPALLTTFPDADIDAVVSRQPSAAPRILRSLTAEHRLQSVVIVSVGTNGALGAGTLDQIRVAIGDRPLVLVDTYADRPWIAGVNTDLDQYAAQHPGTVVARWAEAISRHRDLLGPDGIHPGTAGGHLYAEAVTRAVRAAEADR